MHICSCGCELQVEGLGSSVRPRSIAAACYGRCIPALGVPLSYLPPHFEWVSLHRVRAWTGTYVIEGAQ
jgi:hypothetical protein